MSRPYRPSVTACLIAKNEAQYVGNCLSSIRGQVDEIVFVDTGSTDKTVSIARQFDARVFHFPWQNDFSAPRNMALDQATSDWILYIDADERLVCAPGTRLSSSLTAPDVAAALVKFHPRSDMTAYAEYRLFRRDHRIRFQGAMHESMVPGVRQVCAEDGSRVSDLFEIEILHDGYEGDQSHKHARNMPLLKRAIAVDPHRVYLRFHLGMTLMELGRTDEACSQLRAGMEMATRDGASERARVEGSSCAQLLSAMFLANGQAAAALEMARQGRALYQGNLALCWGEGRCLLDLGQPAEAIEAVEPLLSLDPEQVFDPKIAYQKSLFRSDSLGVIGSAWFALGEPERAAFFFDEAANHAAAPREYVAKAALARSRARRSVHN